MTIVITADRTIPAGETDSFTNEDGLILQRTAGRAPVVTVNGQIVLTTDRALTVSAALLADSSTQAPAFEVGPTGVLKVTAAHDGGGAYGIHNYGSSGPNIVNHGVIQVSGDSARGVDTPGSGVDLTNTGVISAQGHDAIAVVMQYAHSITNSGTISARASNDPQDLRVVAIDAGYNGALLSNSGTIEADGGSYLSYPAAAVVWSGASVVNTGTLRGAFALATEATSIVNSGQMIGAVQLYDHSSNFANSGQITGPVTMGSGNDTYSGSDGVLKAALHGDDGNDLIIGGPGGETLSGDAGNDTIEGGGGEDVLDGGAGFNTLSFSHATTAVSVGLANHSSPASGATISNFQGVAGSAFNDSFSGTDGADSLAGAAGKDTLVGGLGADTLSGGDGDDVLSAGAGANILFGDGGSDTLSGGAGAATLDGGAGHDVIICGAGSDRIVVGLGQSSLQAGVTDIVQNWSSSDVLQFANSGSTPNNFLTATAADYASALATANAAIFVQGYKFVAVAVGSDVVVFADSGNDRGMADDAVVLQGRTLSDISAANISAQAAQPRTTLTLAAAAAPTPAEPAAPVLAINGAHGTAIGNMDAAHLVDLFPAILTKASSTQVAASGAGGLGFTLTGSGFSYVDNQLTAGQANHFTFNDVANGAKILQLDLSLPQTNVGSFQYWLATDQTQVAFGSILSGGDQLAGAASGDLIRGYGGNDLISGGGGGDSLYGGDGNDVIYAGLAPGVGGSAPAGATWLRGELGDDYIAGGAGFDNINGNQGADTINGGSGGNDWLVGGQGNDMIFAHAGDNIINGNLGDDSIVGGTGHDSLRGGQGNDVIWAGSGGDWITGDRGNDTLVAGQGSDTFYVIQGSGVDRVFGFDPVHDRIQAAAGVTYQVAQIGADIVVDFGQGDAITLAGVQQSALPAGWITA